MLYDFFIFIFDTLTQVTNRNSQLMCTNVTIRFRNIFKDEREGERLSITKILFALSFHCKFTVVEGETIQIVYYLCMKINIISFLEYNTEGQKLYFRVVWFPSLPLILKLTINMVSATTKNMIT